MPIGHATDRPQHPKAGRNGEDHGHPVSWTRGVVRVLTERRCGLIPGKEKRGPERYGGGECVGSYPQGVTLESRGSVHTTRGAPRGEAKARCRDKGRGRKEENFS